MCFGGDAGTLDVEWNEGHDDFSPPRETVAPELKSYNSNPGSNEEL